MNNWDIFYATLGAVIFAFGIFAFTLSKTYKTDRFWMMVIFLGMGTLPAAIPSVRSSGLGQIIPPVFAVVGYLVGMFFWRKPTAEQSNSTNKRRTVA